MKATSNKLRWGQQATITSEGGAFSGELQGRVTYIRPQIRKKDIFDTDPAADIDSRGCGSKNQAKFSQQ